MGALEDDFGADFIHASIDTNAGGNVHLRAAEEKLIKDAAQQLKHKKAAGARNAVTYIVQLEDAVTLITKEIKRLDGDEEAQKERLAKIIACLAGVKRVLAKIRGNRTSTESCSILKSDPLISGSI